MWQTTLTTDRQTDRATEECVEVGGIVCATRAIPRNNNSDLCGYVSRCCCCTVNLFFLLSHISDGFALDFASYARSFCIVLTCLDLNVVVFQSMTTRSVRQNIIKASNEQPQRWDDLIADDWSTIITFWKLEGPCIVASWQRGQGGNCTLPLNSVQSENCWNFFSCRKLFAQSTANFGLNSPFCRNLRAKLKFWAPIISSVGNLQLSVWKLQLPVPPTFVNPWRCWPWHHACSFLTRKNLRRRERKWSEKWYPFIPSFLFFHLFPSNSYPHLFFSLASFI